MIGFDTIFTAGGILGGVLFSMSAFWKGAAFKNDNCIIVIYHSCFAAGALHLLYCVYDPAHLVKITQAGIPIDLDEFDFDLNLIKRVEIGLAAVYFFLHSLSGVAEHWPRSGPDDHLHGH